MKEITFLQKLTSRKFIVWLTATLFVVAGFVFRKDLPDVIGEILPWWGGISMIYIGGNVAQDWAVNKLKGE